MRKIAKHHQILDALRAAPAACSISLTQLLAEPGLTNEERATLEHVCDTLAWRYRSRVQRDEILLDTSPGSFQHARPCGGRGVCHEPVHGCFFWGEGIQHTMSLVDGRVVGGRFASPYRTWCAVAEIALRYADAQAVATA